MGYLGHAGQAAAKDNLFQQMFWPSADASRWDRMGMTGLLVCVALACYHLYGIGYQGQIGIALVTAAFYVSGGCGIRNYNPWAALVLAIWGVLGEVGNWLMKLPFSGVGVIGTMLLFAFLRGTLLARRSGSDHTSAEAAPPQSTVRTGQGVDQGSRRWWKITRYPFFLFGGAMVLISAYGTALAISQHGLGSVFSLERVTSGPTAPAR
jgi:hypothetical protein